ncbi:MAG: DUF4433 domain-containing protein [Proteobacteria bacterium]|nr:DUF4433 domain-containing protein [Pseudomonadota bacterium]
MTKTVADIIAQRRLREVVHFTTNRGLVGILDCGAVLPYSELGQDERLEFILQYNCPTRYDSAWLAYVNLSLSDINANLFEIAKDKWHAGTDIWWCILAFAPTIMQRPGVYFVTTNNMYPSARRALGAAGLESLFAPTVAAQYGRVVHRSAGLHRSQTTCEQAEVLYPGRLPLDKLSKIYVATDHHYDAVAGQLSALERDIPIDINPDKFYRRSSS